MERLKFSFVCGSGGFGYVVYLGVVVLISASTDIVLVGAAIQFKT